MIINDATWLFVRQHAGDDVRQLALQGAKDAAVDLPQALQQIAGWQTACRKLPLWAATDGIVYPPHLNMEQCSSEQTARYKARLAGQGGVFVDLSGGFGVDFYWMSQGFERRVYVEQNASLCALAEHNFRLLNLACSVCCCTTESYLSQTDHADTVFLDPARRDGHGGRTYALADCTPNVLELLPLLRQKSDRIILKLSPMLDWRKAVADLGHVSQVHIVSVDNECKELLLVLGREEAGALQIHCVNNGSSFVIDSTPPCDSRNGASESDDRNGASESDDRNGASLADSRNVNASYLYEPNASIMKAGCFSELEECFPVSQLAHNSHLFVSGDEVAGFPGRRFRIEHVCSMNKRDLKTALTGITHANISVRNFPLSADELRRKLKVKDGGDVFFFGTTTADRQHKLFICRKIG